MSRRIGIALAVLAALANVVALVGAPNGALPDAARRPMIGVALLTGAILAVTVLIVVIARPGVLDTAQDRDDLAAQAHTDSLTGLRNHRAFHEDLARELALSEARGRSVGLVMLDVDGLKLRNDTAGHQAGDQLIAAMAEAIRSSLRHRDNAYRVGGDEFAVILPDETTWGAFRFAQRLQGILAQRPQADLSASAGVSASRGQSRDELIYEADLALIGAKRGRRGALIYTDDLAVRDQPYSNSERQGQTDLVCAALGRAADTVVGSPSGYSERVAELAAQVARELGYDAASVARLRRAGLLHQVGRLAGDTDVNASGARIATANGLTDEAEWICQQDDAWSPRAESGTTVHGAGVLRIARLISAALPSDADESQQTEALVEVRMEWSSELMPDALDAVASILGTPTHVSNL